MKAILCSQYCGPDDLVLADVPDPVAAPGEAVIAIKAAALNQAVLRRKQYGSLVSCEFIAHQFVPKLTTRTRMPPTPL